MEALNPKFILVGCGHIAKKHLPEIYRTGSLVAVCDTSIKNINSLGIDKNIERYTSFQELIANHPKADVSVICTPNAFHAEQSIALLNLGFHVLCEKPMAIHSADAQAMISAAENNNRQLTIVKQIRHNKPIQTLKHWISTGRSGQIFSIVLNGVWNRGDSYYHHSDWHGKKTLDGGILYTQFSHFIDLLIWLFGDVQSVKSSFQNVHHAASSEFEDQGAVIINFEKGTIGSLHFSINSFERNLETSLLVIAENGNIKISGQYCDTLEYAHTKNNEFSIAPVSGPIKHSAVYDHFLQGIANKVYDQKSLTEAYKSIQLIERIYQVP